MIGLLLKLLWSAIGDDLPAVDDDRPGTNCFNFLQNVGRENNGFLFPHPPDQGPHLVLLVWIQTIRRLVQNQHIGIMNDRLSEAGSMAVTFRECFDALVQD